MKEEWRDVVGYEGLYRISNRGRVLSLYSGKILSPKSNDRGYCMVALYRNGVRKDKRVHRLVARAFLEGPHDRHINHKNGKKVVNAVSNLEYVTPSENIKHAWDMGLRPENVNVGEQNPSAKISAEQAREIKYLLANTDMRQYEIAEHYGIHSTTVSKINRGHIWGDV